jgi:hypothetical protein
MPRYTVALSFSHETKLYKTVEPSGLELENTSLDALVKALPAKATEAYNLPPGTAEALELLITIPPLPPAGPTGTTGTTGPTGTTGTTGASGPTGMF